MDNYLEVYTQWYPNNYGLNDYPLECHVTYDNNERKSLFQQLTKPQQELINQQKKYQVRSLFLQNQYLFTSDWEFVRLNIDDDYERGKRSQLKCDCGRPLKYQFVIESKQTGQEVHLGIQHFKDHLGIPQSVAEDIKKGVAHVDLALDELLWLTAKPIPFPEDLWQRYVFAYYRNNTLRRPIALNQKLADRVLAFRQVEMPLFITDYLAVLGEINQVDREVFDKKETSFLADKQAFEKYLTDFDQDIVTPLYQTRIFFARRLTDFIKLDPFVNESYEAAKNRYFDEILSFCLSLKGKVGVARDKSIRNFITYHVKKYEGQTIIPFIINKYEAYQFTKNFFFAIPKVYRVGIRQAIKRKQERRHPKNRKVAELGQ